MSLIYDPLCFTVNQCGVIVHLSVTWPKDQFYGDMPAFGIDLVGTLLSDHIAGEATRDLVARMLAAVNKSGQSLSLPYRCDTPWAKRIMEMRISPCAVGGVVIGHRQILDQLLPEELRFRTLSAHNIVRCSFCNRIDHAGLWIDISQALKLGLLTEEDGNPSTYVVCKDCDRRAQMAMHSLRKDR